MVVGIAVTTKVPLKVASTPLTVTKSLTANPWALLVVSSATLVVSALVVMVYVVDEFSGIVQYNGEHLHDMLCVPRKVLVPQTGDKLLRYAEVR